MNLSHFLGVILFVSLIFVCWGLIISDFETNYIETGISNAPEMNASYKDNFENYSTIIGEEFNPILDKFQNLSQEPSWFDKIVGVASIPLVILTLPITFATILYNLFIDIPEFANLIGIPPVLIYFGVVAISIYLIFKFVNLFKS